MPPSSRPLVNPNGPFGPGITAFAALGRIPRPATTASASASRFTGTTLTAVSARDKLGLTDTRDRHSLVPVPLARRLLLIACLSAVALPGAAMAAPAVN